MLISVTNFIPCLGAALVTGLTFGYSPHERNLSGLLTDARVLDHAGEGDICELDKVLLFVKRMVPATKSVDCDRGGNQMYTILLKEYK